MILNLDLDNTWKFCIEMYTDIVAKLPANFDDLPDQRYADNKTKSKKLVIVELKDAWMEANFPEAYIKENCFFCEYGNIHSGAYSCCTVCPGKMVDKSFSCTDLSCLYYKEPRKFLEKILELDEIRRNES